MKRLGIATLGIWLLGLALSPGAQSDTVFVEATTGTGVAESDLRTATVLISTAVSEVSSDQVVDRAASADIVLRPTLIRLGGAYLLSLSRIQKEHVVFSSKLKAEHIEELDKVAQRLTRSVLASEVAAEAPRVGEITDQEAHEGTQRRPTRSINLVNFGAAELSNLNSKNVGIGFGFGHGWDLNAVLLKITAQLDIDGSAWLASATLGGNYFFSTTNTAPYSTADFGAGLAKLDGGGTFNGETVGGFVLGGGGGILFFRTSSVNLDLGFRASILLHANSQGTPISYSLRLGLCF